MCERVYSYVHSSVFFSSFLVSVYYYSKYTFVALTYKLSSNRKNPRFLVCDLNLSIGINARVVVARFARRHLWGIWAAVSVGSQCVVARFARRHVWDICATVSVGSQCVVARFARRDLRGICAAVSVGSPCVVARFARRHLTGVCAAVSVG